MKLSSGPPNFLTIFRRENTVPNISFASSCALNFPGRFLGTASAGALMGGMALELLELERGRVVVLVLLVEGGRSVLVVVLLLLLLRCQSLE